MDENSQLSVREEQARRLAETLRRQFGTTLCGLLEAPDVVELMLNSDGRIWADRLGRDMVPVYQMAPAAAESLIATVASTIRSTVTRENPILECELPLAAPFGGARFEAVIPPNVSPGPVFTIRRKASAVFTLDQYVTAGIMTTGQCAAIKRAVREQLNVLVVGGTGTGKTTLTNAILAYMAEVATSSCRSHACGVRKPKPVPGRTKACVLPMPHVMPLPSDDGHHRIGLTINAGDHYEVKWPNGLVHPARTPSDGAA